MVDYPRTSGYWLLATSYKLPATSYQQLATSNWQLATGNWQPATLQPSVLENPPQNLLESLFVLFFLLFLFPFQGDLVFPNLPFLDPLLRLVGRG